MSNLAASPGALGLRSPQHVCGVRSPPPTPRVPGGQGSGVSSARCVLRQWLLSSSSQLCLALMLACSVLRP